MLDLSLIVKATAILALVLGGVRLAGGARASARHAFLACAFGILLALPVATVLMPQVTVQIPVGEVSPMPSPAIVAEEVDYPISAIGTNPSSSSADGRWISLSASTLLRVGWAVGATFFLVPLIGAFWQLRRVRLTGLPWLNGQRLTRGLAIQAGVSRSVDVLLHEEIAAPMTCGLVRPLIVLPADAPKWNDADLQRAIVHELEHVHRADWPVRLLARVVCSLYWFHPLVWTAWRHLCLESERACDDAVLRGGDRMAYAEQLVSLARRLVKHDAPPMLSMANRSDLSARVSAVLDMRQRRGRTSTRHVTMIVGIGFALVLVLSPLQAVGQGTLPQPLSQSPARPVGSLAFEVASIKPDKSGDPRTTIEATPGRFAAAHITLRQLIAAAYRVQGRQIVGGPDWLNTERFEIQAIAEGNPSPDQLASMIRALLAERFKLTLHDETGELPVYSLVVARSDGRLGPQLRRSACDLPGNPFPHNATVPGPFDPSESIPCGTVKFGGGRLMLRGMPMSRITREVLSLVVNRVVLDRSGLSGQFDLNLQWTPVLPPRPAGAPPPMLNGDVIDLNGPTIFEAVQDQLGLRLDSQQGQVGTLVIDGAERPTPD